MPLIVCPTLVAGFCSYSHVVRDLRGVRRQHDPIANDDVLCVAWDFQAALCVVSWLFVRRWLVNGAHFLGQRGFSISTPEAVKNLCIGHRLAIAGDAHRWFDRLPCMQDLAVM